MRTRRKLQAALLAATLGFVCYWFGGTPRTGNRPAFPARKPLSLEISLLDVPFFTISDTNGINGVMEMLKSGRSVEPHMRLNRGVMTLNFSDRKPLRIGFTPGHHFLRYEFSMMGAVYSISRS